MYAGCKDMRVQGSYTVEAALIVPVVLGCILLVLSRTITLYEEVTKSTVYSIWWQEFTPEESFRKIQNVEAALQKIGEKEKWK